LKKFVCFKFCLLALLLIFALTFVVACGGDAENAEQNADDGPGEIGVKTIKFSVGENEQHFLYDAAVAFKEHIEKETNGSIMVEIYPGGSLGNDREVLEAMQLGQIEMNAPSPAVLANFSKEFNLLTFPFIFPTQEIAEKVTTGPVGQELLSRLQQQGFVGLSIPNFGYRHVTNNKRPINSVDDLKDLKIRTMESKVHLDAFRALGANPTAMGWSDVFTGLQQGTIDGQENPLATIYTYKVYEVQDYISKTAHVYDWTVFVISNIFWDTLDSEQQNVIREAAEIARQVCSSRVAEEDALAEENIIKEGVPVNDLTDEARQEMSDIIEPVRLKYAEEADMDLYKRLMEEVKKAQ